MAKAAYPTIGIAALVMFGIVYFIGCLRLFAVAAYVIKMQLKKKRGSIVCYDTPFFNLSEFYQVAMIILLPE